jgi:hypothetical protein
MLQIITRNLPIKSNLEHKGSAEEVIASGQQMISTPANAMRIISILARAGSNVSLDLRLPMATSRTSLSTKHDRRILRVENLIVSAPPQLQVFTDFHFS